MNWINDCIGQYRDLQRSIITELVLIKLLSSINLKDVNKANNYRINHVHLEGPQHLICFNKNWHKDLVIQIISSAINLKCACANTHGKQLNVLPNTKVIVFEDHNEPILRMAVSKAASFLGATDVHITGKMLWNNDYNGRIFSELADVIFVSTQVFECVRRFARCSTIPVVSLRCRRHATLQSLATLMSIMEDYGSMESFNLAYIGAPHPIVNDYLMLSTMFNINFNFKCCCKKIGVSPLLLEDCKEKCKKNNTKITTKQTCNTDEALKNSDVIIAGPTPSKEKISEFQLSTDVINKHAKPCWTFYHTFPRGPEVDDNLFWHSNTRTFNAFKNTQYIAAAIMAHVVRGYTF